MRRGAALIPFDGRRSRRLNPPFFKILWWLDHLSDQSRGLHITGCCLLVEDLHPTGQARGPAIACGRASARLVVPFMSCATDQSRATTIGRALMLPVPKTSSEMGQIAQLGRADYTVDDADFDWGEYREDYGLRSFRVRAAWLAPLGIAAKQVRHRGNET